MKCYMFAAFNLDTNNDYNNYYEIGKNIFDENRKKVSNELESYINGDGSLSGTKMQEKWFPQINANIFISHSHKDEDKAIGLAGWLYSKFKLTTFIDSCVWGYCNDLLRLIDNRYCLNEGEETYNYFKRNYSTSHVHMMLSTALSMMIDKTECLFFLNTPNSINTSEIVKNTESPWIYSELAMTKLVRNRSLKEYRHGKIGKKVYIAESHQEMSIKYDVSLDNLVRLNDVDLSKWELNNIINNNNVNENYGSIYDTEKYPLDDLYDIKGLITRTLHS